VSRVSYPHPFHADPDLGQGFQIFADPDLIIELFADPEPDQRSIFSKN